MALTAKQNLFVKEYLIDKNATQAAIRAGYSEKTAKDIGCENLTKPNIQEAIQKVLNKTHEKLDVTVERIEAEFEKVGFSNMTDFVDWEKSEEASELILTFKEFKELTPAQKACIAEVSVTKTLTGQKTFKIKLYDKLKALEALGRHKAMFTDKTENTLTGNVTVEMKVGFE